MPDSVHKQSDFSVETRFIASLSPSLSTFLPWLIFFSCLFLFTVSLTQFGSCHGLGLEGSRYALFTQEMFRNGITLFPTVYGQTYSDYTVTQTLLTYAFSLLSGKVTALSLVLPTAIASAITLTLTYRIGALHSRAWGYCAALLTLTSFEFFILARAPSLDQFVATATIFCFYQVYTAQYYQSLARLWWIPLGLIAGFLFRGAIGLIIPASVVGAFYLAARNYKYFWLTTLTSLFLLLLCVGGLFALADYVGGHTLVNTIWQMQIYGRINEEGGHHHFYYYLINGLVNYAPSFPLALLVIVGLHKQLWSPQNGEYFLLRCLASWFLIILIGLSIPMEKHARYLVALTPAAALLATYPFVTNLPNRWLNKIKLWANYFCLALPWLTLSLAVTGLGYNYFGSHSLDANFLLVLMGSILILSFGLSTQLLRNLTAGVCTILMIYIWIVMPVTTQFNSLRPLASKLSSWLTPHSQLAFYNVGPDSETEDIKLMAQLDTAIKPQFLYKPEEIQKDKLSTIFITQEPYLQNLPLGLKQQLQILFYGSVDRKTWVIFTKKELKT